MDPDTKKPEEPDPRNSLKHVLQSEPEATAPHQDDAESSKPSPRPDMLSADDNAADMPSNGNSVQGDGPSLTGMTNTVRRNANGSVSSVYSGNKIRHLKKDDGVPLWRKDIQYDFLRYIFEDDKKVFHKASDKTFGHTFADIYLDAMANSSKCSKILKDKLLNERSAALNMAMVCLLVNVGRMNTTLNCTPPGED
jgi:Ino eighty subunit 1